MSGSRDASPPPFDFDAFWKTIVEMENERKRASFLKTLDEYVEPSDPFYARCVDHIEASIKAGQKTTRQCEKSTDNTNPSTSQENSSISEYLRNIIIVNQIPERINGVPIDREKFFSLFSQYGTIKNAYLTEGKPQKSENFGRIIYNKEDDAYKVWKASQEKLMKYDDHVLMITLASGDYCPIQNLPDNCLREIFLRISSIQDKFNVELVCKRWNSIGRESWSSISKVPRNLKSHIWKTIISRTTESIRDVQLDIMDEFEDDEDEAKDSMKSLSLIADNLNNLESFAVSIYITNSSAVIPLFHTIISNNKSLKRLCLWRVAIDDGFIDLLPAGMREIQINSSEQRGRSIGSGPVSVSRFQNLQVLGLFNFDIDENQLEGIECLENLKVLKLKESYVHPSNIDKIVNFTKLEHLSMTDNEISDITLSKILKNNKSLKHLDISGIKGMTDASFQYVSQLPHLQVLLMKNLDKVTDKYFTAMPSLKKLNCNGCPLITDTGIQRLFTLDSSLKKLYIANCSITLESLKTASNWAPYENRLLLICVSREMIEKWNNSGFKKLLRLDRTGVFVCQYEEGLICDPIEDDWLEIFDESAQTDDPFPFL